MTIFPDVSLDLKLMQDPMLCSTTLLEPLISPVLDDTEQNGDADEDDTEESNTPDSENDETKLEEILNSSENNLILESLELKNLSNNYNTSIIPQHHEINDSIINVLNNDENINNPLNIPIFDDINPLKRSLDGEDPKENGAIKTSSPLKKKSKLNTYQPNDNSLLETSSAKSKIPLPIRKSKRILSAESIIDEKRICSPIKQLTKELNIKPSIKVYDTPILNFIVDSSTGLLSDATKYATEINSINGYGVPLPENETELVTIPINGQRKTNKSPRIAFVKCIKFNNSSKIENGVLKDNNYGNSYKSIGFYTESQWVLKKKQINNSKDNNDSDNEVNEVNEINDNDCNSINDRNGIIGKKLRWADELEW
ncbi:hypothetical protein WICMUC_001519 [Wickerhamomyces mucosus]|uniref:Uncharacterized protein n=1 Tax=Wickerhamomyces mucosus TaxID=1378264 RepID=A0A9P8PUQ5_9ASCO|nr:hypothetical protein WICMUC_001519 [Wickerhamomyces mucosus]